MAYKQSLYDTQPCLGDNQVGHEGLATLDGGSWSGTSEHGSHHLTNDLAATAASADGISTIRLNRQSTSFPATTLTRSGQCRHTTLEALANGMPFSEVVELVSDDYGDQFPTRDGARRFVRDMVARYCERS